MKTLYIIRGVPGSGKSTLARRMRAELGAPYYEADMWMVDSDGNYLFDPKRLPYCHQMCQQHVCRDMIEGVSIIVSNTFIRRWEADAYYVLAKIWGYEVKVILCEGGWSNEHGVPPDRVAIMKSNVESYENQKILSREDLINMKEVTK